MMVITLAQITKWALALLATVGVYVLSGRIMAVRRARQERARLQALHAPAVTRAGLEEPLAASGNTSVAGSSPDDRTRPARPKCNHLMANSWSCAACGYL